MNRDINYELQIFYEDDDMAVVLKPAGISTHEGVEKGEVFTDILKKHFESLSLLGGEDRPGIVHRLDKDTSGLLLIAKTDRAYEFLTQQMKARTIEKYYKVLVFGHLEPRTGTIEAPVGRSFHNRKKMTSFNFSGRPAVTHYKVLQYVRDCSFLDVRIETGRTHQIRVHFQSIGFPVVGDPGYGRKSVNVRFEEGFGLKRQFLHAYKLVFQALDGKQKTVEVNLPPDLQKVLDNLGP